MALAGDKKKEYQRQLMAKRRGLTSEGLTEEAEMLDPGAQNVRPNVAPKASPKPGVTPTQAAGWAHVVEFIKREPRPGDIPNLLKLQRTAGALAHCSKACDDVPTWFGGLDIREIGKFLGTAEYNMPPSGPPVRV